VWGWVAIGGGAGILAVGLWLFLAWMGLWGVSTTSPSAPRRIPIGTAQQDSGLTGRAGGSAPGSGSNPLSASPLLNATQVDVPEPVSAHPIRLQVLNGCGVKGLGKVVSPGLRQKGFDVRETRNAANFAVARSSVIDRVGNLALANAVADSLGIDRVRVSSESSKILVDIDVTLVVGADYKTLRINLNTKP
jgi:hypothetical protein